MKETLKIYKREAFAFGFSFFMLFIAYICKYVLYLEHIVSTVFSLLSLTGIIILTALIIWRLLIENKLLMLVTIVILFSMAIFNSTQTNAVIFPLIFELIRKCITYKSPLDTMSLENKIKRFNNEKNTVKLKMNKPYYEYREKYMDHIFKLMVYCIWILPVFFYDVLISLASYRSCVNKETLDSFKNSAIIDNMFTAAQTELTVNRITGSDEFNKKIFVFANNVLMKCDKLMICMILMISFTIFFFIFLFTSTNLKTSSHEYAERKKRAFIKNLPRDQKGDLFFTEDEIAFIDKEQ